MTSAQVYTVKSGDTYPVRATLRDAAGHTAALDQAAVLFVMRQIDGPKLVSTACTIEDATKGRVRFDPLSSTFTKGVYHVEFRVTYADGKVQTFPNSGYSDFVVEDALSG